MSQSFTASFHARWGEMDFNGHMKNTAYLDTAANVRMMYFAARGFPMSEFGKLAVGPVIFRDDIEYYRELRMLDPYTVDIALAGLSKDRIRFRLRNAFYRDDGKKIAQVTSVGGRLDLSARKLIAPPEALAQLLTTLHKTDDFDELDVAAKG